MIRVDIFHEDGITKIKTCEDIQFDLNGRLYIVPAGFVSDGMSIPKFFWSVIAPSIDARTVRASIIHDYLYSIAICTRSEADKIFYQLLVEDVFPKWKALCCYLGVRIAGKSHFIS